MNNLIPNRNDIVKSLKEEEFDIIIIGGGITGAGVARDASLRGFRVALFEKNDFAAGTSSMTSKMLHGGLRYLKNYEFRLVRQAALERKVHLDIAPHLSERMQFLVPLYNWSDEGKIMRRLGLFLYDVIAFPKGIGKRKHVSAKELVNKLNLLENDDLIGGSLYFDCKTDDARLTLANILSSTAAGAKILNYAKVEKWKSVPDGIEISAMDLETQETLLVKGRVLIICAGPWSERVENMGEDFNGKSNLRLTRGTHLRMRKKLDEHPCLIVNNDGRPIYLIPQIDYDLAGTTDLDYNGDPNDVAPTLEEIDYIIDACNKLFPSVNYSRDDVVACFSGVRPLIYQKGADEGKTSRDHSTFVDESGIITLVGGKLTTYRVMAKDALKKAQRFLDPNIRNKRCFTDKMPLWGGDIDDWDKFMISEVIRVRKKYNLSDSSARIIVKWYGSELQYFETILEEHGTTLLKKERPWLEAQVIYSCRVEMARTPIDFLRRRTPLMLEENNGLDILLRVVELMANELNWSDDYKELRKTQCVEYVNKFISIIDN